jgi:hypothetical protein
MRARSSIPNRGLLLVAVALFAVTLWSYLGEVRAAPFHPDESRWLNRAHYAVDLFDPLGPTWDDGYLTRGQPPLGSYLMGVGLLAQGRDLETNGVWHFHEGMEWNIARDRMAAADDLVAGRRANAVVAALAVAVVFLAGASLTNAVGGAVGAIFLALHPLHTFVAGQALSDPLLVLLLALTVLAACRLTEGRTWGAAVALGALLGLGGATKLSPLLLAVPLAGLGGFLLARSRRRRGSVSSALDRRLGLRLLALPVIALVTFVAVYPYLWPNPIARTINLFEFRVDEMAIQGEMFPGVAVDDPIEALRRIGDVLGDHYTVSGEIATALDVPANPIGWVDLALVLAGAVALCWGVARRGLRSPRALVATVLLGQTASIVLAMRSDFYRYHLPLVLVSALCVGVGASEAGAWLARLPRRLRARGPRPVRTVAPARDVGGPAPAG